MAAPLEDDEELAVTHDYYSLLNVGKEATNDEITNAFRRLSRVYHPDKHLDPKKKKDAEVMFGKLKRAHEVLTDKHKRTIYDTYGEKGLETEGLEVISRTKTPAEIIAEYERLQSEREERRLQRRTNPKGAVTIGINLTDFFEPYDYEDEDYESPNKVEISHMGIFQSVECPLTVKDTVVVGGDLSTQNGRGQGTFLLTWRRLTSDKGWAELEAAVGNGVGTSLKGFRQFSRRCYGTIGCSFNSTPRGIRPSASAMIAYQFDRDIQGRMTYTIGFPSALNTQLIYSNPSNHAVFTVQLGMQSSYVSLSYTRKFPDADAKIRGAVKIGTLGGIAEYGFEKKITEFSHLGATMAVGVPVGVLLRIKMVRGNQSFMFPIQLAESMNPSAILYGTVVPAVAYFAIQKLIVSPFLKQQKEKELEKKREEHAEKLAKRKQEAKAAMELMQETVERIVDMEERRHGLLIVKAIYGKLSSDTEQDELEEDVCIDVTVPVQALVKDSKLILPENKTKSGLPGFYDPCIGEEKSLYIRYKFRNKLHQVTLADTEPIRIPQQKHLMKDDNSGSNAAKS